MLAFCYHLLMALPRYPTEKRRELARKLGIKEQYLYQVYAGIRVPSPALARRICGLDQGARLQDLRPKDWHRIWPELIGAPGAPEAPPEQEAA